MRQSLWPLTPFVAALCLGGCSDDASTEPRDAGAFDAALRAESDGGMDACTGSCGALDASALPFDAGQRDAGPADSGARDGATDGAAQPVDAHVAFTYGPCPAPLQCDLLISAIARPLIVAADPNAPAGVNACIPPNLAFPAVPACYAPGPCDIGDYQGTCLGMEPPHPKTGYCIKPCL